MNIKKELSIYLKELIDYHHNTQFGSTNGGKVTVTDDENIPDGDYYKKNYAESGKTLGIENRYHQALVEVAAAKIYVLLGVKTTEPFAYFTKENKKNSLSVMTLWNDDLTSMNRRDYSKLNKLQRIQVGRLYVASVLVMNWDMVGTSYDNVMKHSITNNLHIVDTGGSFHFRAQGAPKKYSGDPKAEIYNFLDPYRQAGKAFLPVFKFDPDVLSNAIDKLEEIPDYKFKKIIDYVFDDEEDANLAQELYENLIQRKEIIISEKIKILDHILSSNLA